MLCSWPPNRILLLCSMALRRCLLFHPYWGSRGRESFGMNRKRHCFVPGEISLLNFFIECYSYAATKLRERILVVKVKLICPVGLNFACQ